MSDSNINDTNSEPKKTNNGGDPRNVIIIIAVFVILVLVGALAYLLLANDSGVPGDQPRPEQPIAPTPELAPEQPIAPTPELQPEQPIAPSPEASAPFFSNVLAVSEVDALHGWAGKGFHVRLPNL